MEVPVQDRGVPVQDKCLIYPCAGAWNAALVCLGRGLATSAEQACTLRWGGARVARILAMVGAINGC